MPRSSLRVENNGPRKCNIANPTGGDDRSQGDDHIRLVKNVLKNSFPNITNVVNATAAQLNSASTHYVPTGGIIMWSGSIISIPSGWLLCDGTLGTPNLVDKFIRGASDAEGKEPGFLGGSGGGLGVRSQAWAGAGCAAAALAGDSLCRAGRAGCADAIRGAGVARRPGGQSGAGQGVAERSGLCAGAG